ncbi:hypothetical protein [Parafrankia sp. BMG5.11]|uniref:hypothetical protein n=1 Tax=Parafrankia sp. BMG5.11 TaxID=222540 RepID=UPI0027D31F5C|nr:hypothetical protein [Parafrankia sp. BMG5.11]
MRRLRKITLASAVVAFTMMAFPASAKDRFWRCPENFTPKIGLNVDFPSDGIKRAFVVVPPRKPAPRSGSAVWVPLTGTVEATDWNLNVPRSGNNAALADAGFMVVAPVRQCANQDPALAAGPCNGVGKDGWNWNPWNDGRAPTPAGEVWRTDAGPDSRFMEAMVRCVGTKWPLDRRRLFLGGISAGGTMTNRALLFNSAFWAGGMPISGEWYVTKDDGSPLSFAQAREAVIANPRNVFQGRVGPMPLPRRVKPLIVLTVWGGDKDIWYCGSVLCADYRPSTQAGSNYFSAQRNVVHISCKAGHGHMWPQVNTDAFNLWALKTLASHPKGTPVKRFALTPPPEGYSCQIGPFTGLYDA